MIIATKGMLLQTDQINVSGISPPVNGVTLSLICHLDMGSIRYRSNTQHSDIRELRVLDGLFR